MVHNKSLFARIFRSRVLYLLMLPTIILFAVFTYYSLANGIRISLQDFRFIGDSKFIGLKNYIEALRTPGFRQVFINTLIIGGWNIVLTAFVPMIIALLLNEIRLGVLKRATQTMVYVPYLFSWAIVGGIWIFMLSPDVGLVNLVRGAFGGEPIAFMTRQAYARPIMIGVNLWKQSGFVCILYLASISGINPELYQAAMIDGAGGFRQAVSITLPELFSTLRVVLLLNIMGALKMFDQIWAMRNEVIAPKVDVLMFYVYQRGLVQFRIGYAAAISVLIFACTLLVTVVSNRFLKYTR